MASELTFTIRKLGNSLGVRFPASISKLLGYKEGDELEAQIQGKTLTLKVLGGTGSKALFPPAKADSA
jgi:antitoxin component of MazEF toxin-antitoxin module